MIIVPVKDGENIERALKKFKRKFEKTGVVKEPLYLKDSRWNGLSTCRSSVQWKTNLSLKNLEV